jgi:tetratricopeptide (TPR) repeat protein
VISVKLYRPLSLSLLAIGALLLAPSAVRAADEPPPELATKTSDSLQKLQPLLDAKNWQGAIDLLNGVAAVVDPDSYDLALISDTLGKLYAQKDDLPHAVEAWEVALKLADAHPNYFQKKDVLELVLSLAQSYSQIGSASKNPDVQREDAAKATQYVKRWLAETPKPTADIETFYASVLYGQATVNEKNVDMGLIAQCQEAALKATRLTVHPKETLYELLYATYAQQNDLVDTAKYLELLAAQYPKKSYWSQLLNAYVNLASSEEKNPDKAREYYIRAIVTMERAQAFGQMRTPKDYFNLFQMYYTAGQIVEATDLLYNGMKDGRIESTEKNWLQLAGALLQDNQYVKAVDYLKEAAERFPESGEIDFQIAQIYSVQMDNPKAAYEYIVPAVQKDHLERPFNTYFYLAYLSYNLEKFPEALAAAEKAATLNTGPENKQLKSLIDLIKQSIALQSAPGGTPATTQ